MKQLILIDDDELIRQTWELMSARAQIKLFCFSSVKSFKESAQDLDRQTPVYLDMDFPDGVSGIQRAPEVYDLGFHNITICTGHDPQDIPQSEYIQGVTSKHFPL